MSKNVQQRQREQQRILEGYANDFRSINDRMSAIDARLTVMQANRAEITINPFQCCIPKNGKKRIYTLRVQMYHCVIIVVFLAI
jgi:hypothetical protein